MRPSYAAAMGLTVCVLVSVGGPVTNAKANPAAHPTTHKAHSVAHGTAAETNRLFIPFSVLGTLSSVKMVGPKIGWAASNRGVYRTTNGGVLWTRVLRGDAAWQTNGQAAFINKNTAYVILPFTNATSHLFVTHEGGRHWKSSVVELGAQTVVQMSFANAHLGWAMTSAGVAGPSEPVAIYKTDDHGYHMHLIVPAPIPPRSITESHGLPQGTLKNGLVFESPTKGWIAAATPGNDILLFESTDGGKTWFSHDITSIPRVFQSDLGGNQQPGIPAFFTSRLGALPVGFNNGGFLLYVTNDGGQHWHFTYPLLTKSAVEYDILNEGHVFVAVGKTLYESMNLGRSWSVVSKSTPTGASLEFVNPAVGFAVGKSLWKTGNGGKTWSAVG